MINRKLILDNAPSNTGEQVHINHVGCEAGVDKKRRLYLKRTDKGIVAYCHHCNESGFARDTDSTARLSGWLTKPDSVVKKQQEKPILAALPFKGKVWLQNYYCDPTDKLFSGVVSEASKVALTLLDPEQNVMGWQTRNLEAGAVPKYVTYYIDPKNTGNSSWFMGNKTLVITEDYLSAYRVSKNTRCSSLALLRTTVSDTTLTQIYDLNFETIVLWLDPDEAGTKGAKRILKQLTHFLPRETKLLLYGMDKEPKECTPTELADALT